VEEKIFNRLIILLIALFLLVRLEYVWTPISYLWDEAAYIGMADGLMKGLPYGWIQPSFHEAFFRAPLLTYGIAAIALILKNAEISAKLFMSVISVLSVVVAYYLGKIIGDKKIGLVSALILATNPFHLLFSFKILAENLFGLLIILSIVFLFLSEKNKKYLIAFILVLSLAIYSRYSGVILIPVVIIALLIFRRDWLKEIFTSKYFFVSAILFTLLMIPILTGAQSQLSERRGMLSGHYLVYWIPLMGAVFPFSLYGVWKSKKSKNIFVLVTIVFLLLVGHEFIATRIRYILFSLPLISIITAYGFAQIKNRKLSAQILILLVVVNGVLGLLLVINSSEPSLLKFPVTLRDPLGFGEINSEKYESYKIASLELKKISNPDDVVLSDSCVFVNIYSERACYWFANKDYLDPVKNLATFVNRTDVKWIYVVDKDALKSLPTNRLTTIYENDFVGVFELIK